MCMCPGTGEQECMCVHMCSEMCDGMLWPPASVPGGMAG